MSENLSSTAIDGLLSQTRRAFEDARKPGAEETETLSGEGIAHDGRVRAVAVAPGRIDAFELDPRVMRDGSEAVCEAMAAAANAALDDLRAKAADQSAGFDVERARSDLEQLQAESLETARTLFGAVHDAMARLDQR
jgi:DNA-binding protein YbaB